MLDVSNTGLDSEKHSAKKAGIHPRTSFDVGGPSGVSTPVDSDEEQKRTDFNTAQKMALTLSPIHSSPEAHRCIRQILRGDFRKYQSEAEQGLRRQRMYLVATDLSEEAAYALEWTIGTVLRDGDTLLAVYAVDEEAGTGGDASADPKSSVAIGEGPNQMKEAAAIVRTLNNEQGLVVPGDAPNAASTDAGRSPSHIRTMSVDRYKDKAERERYYATEEITERCVKLLRKTKLQVRVVVEVFHCKSPKHMITEVVRGAPPLRSTLG
jgi:nucleotide-binding universal stress UspA family protein